MARSYSMMSSQKEECMEVSREETSQTFTRAKVYKTYKVLQTNPPEFKLKQPSIILMAPSLHRKDSLNTR